MKNKMKNLSVITIILMLAMSTVCFAGVPEPTPTPIPELESLAEKVLGAFQWVGIAIAVGLLIFMGIKFMSQGATGQADVKKYLGMYVLGLVCVLAATAIVTAIKVAITKA